MLEMVHDRVATGVTRAVWRAAVLRCGKQMEKLPHYYFSWIVSSRNRDKCLMRDASSGKWRDDEGEDVSSYWMTEKKRNWKLKEEALDRTMWRIRFGRGYGPVVRQTTEWMNVFKWECPVSSPVFILSWFLLKLSNFPALLAKISYLRLNSWHDFTLFSSLLH
jgi:hypothetical protein